MKWLAGKTFTTFQTLAELGSGETRKFSVDGGDDTFKKVGSISEFKKYMKDKGLSSTDITRSLANLKNQKLAVLDNGVYWVRDIEVQQRGQKKAGKEKRGKKVTKEPKAAPQKRVQEPRQPRTKDTLMIPYAVIEERINKIESKLENNQKKLDEISQHIQTLNMEAAELEKLIEDLDSQKKVYLDLISLSK